MIRRQISTALPIYIAIFIFQEAVVNQFHLPGGGFSLILIFSLSWALLGVTVGGFTQILITLIGITIWSLLVTPLVLPIFSRLHAFTFNTRSVL